MHFRISLVYSGNTMMHGSNTPKIVRKQFCPAIKSILKGEADRIELLYTHSKSLGTQEIRHSCYLPIVPDAENRKSNAEYIMEPGAAAVISKLIPKVLSISIYSKWIDSVLSENAIRSVAMQTATDNAMDLKQELSLSYNKLRQQAITSELLDMEAGMLGQK